MAIIKWEPFGEIDRFFNDFPTQNFLKFGRDMAVDLYEEGNNVVAEMNVSGIDPEKIDITVEGNYLRIAGTREEEKELPASTGEGKQFYSKEITRGSFERTLRLPEMVHEEKIEAEYKDGMLKVIMPKTEGKKKEKIKVIVKK
ncbi:TPA: Hsp20/alpha crystallin family protein [Patescibacteria group bacterium]|nr:MAG: Heat shock protein Hsp20 [Parcubacteria group bacterium GW2011_GWD2_42_14]HCC04810.1 Hsp20/alpha crystallin family protein [Patescibacteria group bacterium]